MAEKLKRKKTAQYIFVPYSWTVLFCFGISRDHYNREIIFEAAAAATVSSIIKTTTIIIVINT